MTLMEALSKGIVRPDLVDFYHVARALLVKHESSFDTYDQVFAAVFQGGEMPQAVLDELLSWLEDPRPLPQLTAEELAALERLPLDRLRELFEQRMREQDGRHDGGNRWVGTGGTSPFGHGGRHPAGVRVGGAGGGRTAVQIATERRFRDYRDDRVLDTRDLAVALKKLRRLGREDVEPELDVDASIDATCRNAGDLTLAFEAPRKNQARVLLLMDVGGSMDPHSQRVERLFSAASGLGHWRSFEALCFHNCPYENLWESVWTGQTRPTADLLTSVAPETFLVMVGDASMAPSELTDKWGAIDYWHRNETPGLVWLHRLRSRFTRAVWLNPLPARWWSGYSTDLIRRLFPMFPLTVAGLEDAVDTLVRGKPDPVPELEPRWSR
ncbi:MAG: VWA domain-containing protein [Myxococcota bacterium]|nr:VWA domain-containing protein [Myxococcota bacterium]